MLHQRYQLNVQSIVAEELDGEVIAIDMSSGVYYSMSGWAAWVWSALAAGATPTEVASILSERASTHAASDSEEAVEAFLDQLRSEGLLAERGEDRAPDPLPDTPAGADAGDLRVERYTDMEDLILLDPVHDVDTAAGWPKPAPVE